MKQEFVEKMISKVIPNTQFEIKSYELLEKQFLTPEGNWVPDSPAIFIGITILKEGDDLSKTNLTEFLTNITGFEFAVNRV
jgi:hypothetical protein